MTTPPTGEPRVDVVGIEALAQEALQQEGLLIGRLAANERRGPAPVAADRGGRLDRAGPADRTQVGALTDQGLRDPLVDVDRLVGEPALVAEPAVVDVGVLARQHADDALVADGELDVALRRAQRADTAGALDVPGAGAEPVGPARQRTDRAQFDDVAAERCRVRVAVVGSDEGVRAALGEDQLPVLGDLLAEAHAAVAEDATLAVDRDQRRQRQRLDEVALGLDDAADATAPSESDVLKRAFAALVADRAVERMVDEQELDIACWASLTRGDSVWTTMPS